MNSGNECGFNTVILVKQQVETLLSFIGDVHVPRYLPMDSPRLIIALERFVFNSVEVLVSIRVAAVLPCCFHSEQRTLPSVVVGAVAVRSVS
uniref:Uncharacterized protein n=1 Tax=Gadus morhua TaxID=8049 RepID=A0A8C5CFQ8_GADMO